MSILGMMFLFLLVLKNKKYPQSLSLRIFETNYNIYLNVNVSTMVQGFAVL
jgi:hypothetical protein